MTDELTPQEMVKSLIEAGMSLQEIAKRTGRTPMAVWKIAAGETKEPGYMAVDSLRGLLKEVKHE